MDNLTHTLIGVLAGETVARTTAPDPQGLPAAVRRNLLVALAAIGSNLPDTDLLYSYFDGKVNYLLHHRGHTHTILGAVLLGVLVYALTLWLLRRRHWQVSSSDRRWIAVVLLGAALLHVGMDGTNNYGVHPFWPLYNGWVYGDSVFIIEPLLWAVGAPLAFLLRTLAARILVAGVAILGAVLAFYTGLVPIPIAVPFAVLVLGMLGLCYFSPPRVALAVGLGLWLGTTSVFFLASRIAREDLGALAANAQPQARLLDRVMTPMPVNPICWEVVLVQAEGEMLALRRGMLSIAPSLLSAAECPSRGLDGPSTAPLQAVTIPDTDAFKWYGEVFTPRRELADLVARDCVAAAAMQFLRTPYLASIEGKFVLGDLRYDREEELGFAEIELGSEECPSLPAPWIPPREDVLR